MNDGWLMMSSGINLYGFPFENAGRFSMDQGFHHLGSGLFCHRSMGLKWMKWSRKHCDTCLDTVGAICFFGVCLKTGWIPRIYGNLLMVFCFFLQLGVLGLATFHTSHMIWAAKIRIYPDGSKWWASQKWMALRSTSFSAALLVAHVEPWRKKQLVKAGGESLRIEVSRQGDRHQKCKNGWFKICLHP